MKEKYSAKVANPDKAFIQNTSLVDSACEAIKQLLEQHEAEMVLFADWVEENFYCNGKNGKCENVYISVETGKFYTAKDLLTLFKNRNK